MNLVLSYSEFTGKSCCLWSRRSGLKYRMHDCYGCPCIRNPPENTYTYVWWIIYLCSLYIITTANCYPLINQSWLHQPPRKLLPLGPPASSAAYPMSPTVLSLLFPSCPVVSFHADILHYIFSGFLTCFCPCITFGRIAEIVDKGNTCKYAVIFVDYKAGCGGNIIIHCGSILQLVLQLALCMH